MIIPTPNFPALFTWFSIPEMASVKGSCCDNLNKKTNSTTIEGIQQLSKSIRTTHYHAGRIQYTFIIRSLCQTCLTETVIASVNASKTKGASCSERVRRYNNWSLSWIHDFPIFPPTSSQRLRPRSSSCRRTLASSRPPREGPPGRRRW